MSELHICAAFKNEARYLREWIELHLLVDVSKFHLYQNNSTDDYMSVLQPYIDKEIVELNQWPILPPPPIHLEAYKNCIGRHKGQDIWIAFIDCDEFLFSPAEEQVVTILDTIPAEWGAVGVNWRCFGSSGKEQYEDIPVIERFTYRSLNDYVVNFMDRHIKSIIRMNQEVGIGNNSHFFNVSRGTYSEKGELLQGPFSMHSSKLLRINHYWCKSRQEHSDRILNTGKPECAPGTCVIDWNAYDLMQAQDVDDRDIQKYLPRLKDKLYANIS